MVVCLLLVSVVMVQEVAHDDATVAFFLGHSLAEKQCEEEVKELEVQLVTKEQRLVRLVELLGRGPEARAQLSRLELGVIGSVMTKWEVRGRGRGEKAAEVLFLSFLQFLFCVWVSPEDARVAWFDSGYMRLWDVFHTSST